MKIWDVRSRQVAQTLLGHTGGIVTIAFSPDGTRLASASHDGTVRVWDPVTGKELFPPCRHTFWVIGVTFSPDGNLFASGSWDWTVKIWDAQTGAELRTLRGHNDVVNTVAFSPDGTRLASASGEETVKIWDVKTGQEILTLRGFTSYVWGLAFSPDGTRLATGSGDGTLRIWDTRPWTADAAAEREAVGLLTFLFGKPLCQADVLDYLRSERTITPPARQLALSLVDRYREETDPTQYHQASWAIVRQPYLNVFQYRFALHQAETACRLAPQQEKYQTTLGVAQYRLGQYPAAVETLARAEMLQATLAAGSPPYTLAYLAMAQYQLGHQEQAQTTLARLRETLTQPPWVNNPEGAALLREAETLIEAAPAGALRKGNRASQGAP